MAKSLDDLLKIKGVAAVGEFGLDGKLDRGVFVKTADADFNNLFASLVGPR